MVTTRSGAETNTEKHVEAAETDEAVHVGEKRAHDDAKPDTHPHEKEAERSPKAKADGGAQEAGATEVTEEPAPKKPRLEDTSDVSKEEKAADEDDEKMDVDQHHDDRPIVQDGILEKGHIYIFYRTKVGLGAGETPTSLDDVSKCHLLLVPRASHKEKKRFRFIVLGKKRLPDAKHGREVFWGAVEKFGDDLASLNRGEALGEKNYTTKTRGDRHIEPARIAARGHYAFYSPHPSTPSQRKTYLAIHVSHPAPDALGDVQRELSVYPTASYIIQVKNPTTSSNPRGASLSENKRADFGEGVINEVFGGDADGSGKRFVAANPISLLDYQGAEVLVIADPKPAGDVLEEKDEQDLESKAAKDAEGMAVSSVLNELGLDEETFPCDALEGDWL